MLMGAHVVGTINVVSVLAMAPVIQQTLNLSATEVGLLMTAYYSGRATWSLPAGAFVDRAGVGRILMMAMAGIAVGTSVVAIVQGLPILFLLVCRFVACRFIQANHGFYRLRCGFMRCKTNWQISENSRLC